MAETRTFGAGGQHTDPAACWAYLAARDPIVRDYYFRQVGNCTINNSWADQSNAANRVDLDNHTVRFYCPYADSHQGDPTKGFRIYVNGAAGLINCQIENSIGIENRIEFENLYIEQTTNNNVDLVHGGPNWLLAKTMTTIYRNLLVKGFNTSTGILVVDDPTQYAEVSNCKVWGCAVGIDTQGSTFTPAAYYLDRLKMEFCTIWGCTVGINVFGLYEQRFQIRNLISVSNGVDWGYTGAPAAVPVTIYNSIDSDGTLVSGIQTNLINCLNNQVPADLFISQVDTESGFLRPPNGSVSGVGSVVPTKGKAPLDVNCSSAVNWAGGILGLNGIAGQFETEDIAGYARPGDDNLYTIGCHEVQYDYEV